jgi:hypothetical protein
MAAIRKDRQRGLRELREAPTKIHEAESTARPWTSRNKRNAAYQLAVEDLTRSVMLALVITILFFFSGLLSYRSERAERTLGAFVRLKVTS